MDPSDQEDTETVVAEHMAAVGNGDADWVLLSVRLDANYTLLDVVWDSDDIDSVLAEEDIDLLEAFSTGRCHDCLMLASGVCVVK